jgi:hypothetical protein
MSFGRFQRNTPVTLPDGTNTPAVNTVRRVYVDGAAVTRFEFGLFDSRFRVDPQSQLRTDECAQRFWDTPVYFINQKEWIRGSLPDVFAQVVSKFCERTTPRAYVYEHGLCRRLAPLLQLVFGLDEIPERDATPIGDFGRFFLRVNSLSLRSEGLDVDKVRIYYHPRHLLSEWSHFKELRQIRAHCAWIHADLQTLLSCLDYYLGTGMVSGRTRFIQYVVALAHGISTVRLISQNDQQLFEALRTAFTDEYRGRINALCRDVANSRSLFSSRDRTVVTDCLRQLAG